MRISCLKIENNQDKSCLQYDLISQKVDRKKFKVKNLLELVKYSLHIYHKT